MIWWYLGVVGYLIGFGWMQMLCDDSRPELLWIGLFVSALWPVFLPIIIGMNMYRGFCK